MEEINQNQQVFRPPQQSPGQLIADIQKSIPIFLRLILIFAGSIVGIWVSIQMSRVYYFFPNVCFFESLPFLLIIMGTIVIFNVIGGAYLFLRVVSLLTGRLLYTELIKNRFFKFIIFFWVVGCLLSLATHFFTSVFTSCPSL